jgi:hypothetical protein
LYTAQKSTHDNGSLGIISIVLTTVGDGKMIMVTREGSERRLYEPNFKQLGGNDVEQTGLFLT